MSLTLYNSGRKAKINQLDNTILSNHHIVGFYIPMGYTVIVKIGKGFNYFERNMIFKG